MKSGKLFLLLLMSLFSGQVLSQTIFAFEEDSIFINEGSDYDYQLVFVNPSNKLLWIHSSVDWLEVTAQPVSSKDGSQF